MLTDERRAAVHVPSAGRQVPAEEPAATGPPEGNNTLLVQVVYCRLSVQCPLCSLQVSRPSVEKVQYALKIEGAEITIILSAR